MKRKADKYDLFNSEMRGAPEVESRLLEMMSGLETPENIRKIGDALWDFPNKSVFEKPTLDFTKIEVALNQYKQDNSRKK